MDVVLAQLETSSAHLTGDEEAATVPPKVGLRLYASEIKDLAVVAKLAQSMLLPTNIDMVNKMGLEKVAIQFYHAHTQVGISKHVYYALFLLYQGSDFWFFSSWTS